MPASRPTHCYLCGEPLDGQGPENEDHVPPKQLFAPEVRKAHRVELTKVRVHQACNSAYQLDEDYFVHVLTPLANGSTAGTPIFQKAVKEYLAGKNRALVERVLAQAVDEVGGVYMPPGKVALLLERERFDRVVWKIVRGLHFLECEEILPVCHPLHTHLVIPGERPPEHFEMFMTYLAGESLGRHQGVFAYRRARTGTSDTVNYWAMLLWDRVIVTALYEWPLGGEADEKGTVGTGR